MRVFSVIAAGFFLLLPACQRGGTSDAPDATQSRKIPRAQWNLSQIRFQCATSDCPKSIGALFFEEPQSDDGYIKIYRCTAFLIAPDKIMSNEHCNLSGRAPGQFVLYGGGQGAPQIRTVVGTPFHIGQENLGSEISDGRPDIAVLKLKNPILNVAPMELARGPQKEFQSLSGYVVNGGDDIRNLRIDPIRCQIHRHEILFPYDIKETPDVIFGFGCHAVPGNSGSPLFAPGSTGVQAVLQATSPPQEYSQLTIALQPFVVATNVRCLQYPDETGVSCLKASPHETDLRFQKLMLGVFQSLTKRELPAQWTQKFQFKAMPFLSTPMTPNLENLGILYFPVCHVSKLEDVLPLPVEKVSLKFDKWGEPSIQSDGYRMTTAGFLKLTDSRYLVIPDWTSPLKHTFSIALHECPR